MARNGSGVYSLPAGNPVVTGTIISSTVHNNTMNDLAAEMTNSVDKDGQTVLTGALDFNGNKQILDADGDTSIHADTDDEIDFEIAGADDFKMLANIFRALSGSSLEADTINETTADTGVTVDSVLLKDAGIDFSSHANQAGMTSEVFDHYEEGTFTPTFSTSTGSGTPTYTAQDGIYTKVGNLVHVDVRLAISSWDSRTGSISIAGLPYASIASEYASCPVGFVSGAAVNTGEDIIGHILPTTSTISLMLWEATTGTNALDVAADTTATFQIYISGSYRTS